MPLVTKQDDSKVDTTEKTDRFVDNDKTFIREGLGSGVQVETRARSVQYWSGNSMNDTGLAYNISGRATVIEASVGERLAGFQDPIKAIFGTTVCKDKTVIVKRKYVIGGGVTITPERAPARTVQVKEDVSSVELTRYGGDITMNTNLFLTPALAQAEMDMKVNAQKGELEKKLIELGYNEIISKAVRLPDAAVRANPTFYGTTASATAKENYATMVYNRSCFGAFAKHEFPLANLLASCKKTGAYLAADGPSTLLVIPHGSSEMLRYTKKSSMQYSISGLSTADQKPVNMSISNVAEDPSSGVKIMVHVPPTDNASGAAFPTTSQNHLSETVTIYTFHRTVGGVAVNFVTGGEYTIGGDGRPLSPGPPGSGGGGRFEDPRMFMKPDSYEQEFATWSTKLSGLELLREALGKERDPGKRKALEDAIKLCKDTSTVFSFLSGNPTNMAEAIASAGNSEDRIVHGLIGKLLTRADSTGYASVVSTLNSMKANADAASKAEFDKVIADIKDVTDATLRGYNSAQINAWQTATLNKLRRLGRYYRPSSGKAGSYAAFEAVLSSPVVSPPSIAALGAIIAARKNWLTSVSTRKTPDFYQSVTNSGMLSQSSTAVFPQTLVESLTDEDYGLRALLAARLTFGAEPGAFAEVLASDQSTKVLESIMAGARPHDFDALQNFMLFRMNASKKPGSAFPEFSGNITLFHVMVSTCIGLSADKITPGQSAANGDMLHAVIAGYMPIVDSFQTNLHQIKVVYEFIATVGAEYAKTKNLEAAARTFSRLVDNFGDGDIMVPFTVLLHASFEAYEHERVTSADMQTSFTAILRCGCTIQSCVPGMTMCDTNLDFSGGKVSYGTAMKKVLVDMINQFVIRENEPMCNSIQLSAAVALSRALLSPGTIVQADGGDNTGTSNAGRDHTNVLSANAIILNAYVIANLAGINVAALVPSEEARGILTKVTDSVRTRLGGYGDSIFKKVLETGRDNVSQFATTFHTIAATVSDAAKVGAKKAYESVSKAFGHVVLVVQKLAEAIFAALDQTEWFKPIGDFLGQIGATLEAGVTDNYGVLAVGAAVALAKLVNVPETVKKLLTSDIVQSLNNMITKMWGFCAELLTASKDVLWDRIKAVTEMCIGVMQKLYDVVPKPSDALTAALNTCRQMAATVGVGNAAGGMVHVHPGARIATLRQFQTKMVQLATSSSMIAPQGPTEASYVSESFANRVSGKKCTVRRLKLKMSSAVIAKCGADTGELLVGYPMTGVSTNQRTESMTVALRVYLGAILKKPENVTIIPHVAFEGVVSCDFDEVDVAVNPEGMAHFEFDNDTIDVPYVPGADYRRDTAGGGWTSLTTNSGALGHLDHFDYVDCVNGLQIYNSARGK